MTVNVKSNLRSVIRNSVHMYFAPIIAAINTMRIEEDSTVANRSNAINNRVSGGVTIKIASYSRPYKGNFLTLQSKPSTTLATPIMLSYFKNEIRQR